MRFSVPFTAIADLLISNNRITFNKGTSFPSSPSTNDLFYRTDFRAWFQYDGSAWRQTTVGDFTGSFPASPTTNLRARRVDLGLSCFYDGTRWLTEHEYSVQFTALSSFSGSYSATQSDARWTGIRSDYQIWITRMETVTFSNATGANYFTFSYVANNGTTVWSFTTAADAANQVVTHVTTSATQPGGLISYITLTMTKTGTITTFPNNPIMLYRLIVT